MSMPTWDQDSDRKCSDNIIKFDDFDIDYNKFKFLKETLFEEVTNPSASIITVSKESYLPTVDKNTK